MKVQAYRCDYCGHIREYEAITGVYPVQDMFERIRDYPICPNPDKTNIHFCTECYNRVVLEKARTISKKHDERGYELKISELGYLLRSQCVMNVRNNKKFVLHI